MAIPGQHFADFCLLGCCLWLSPRSFSCLWPVIFYIEASTAHHHQQRTAHLFRLFTQPLHHSTERVARGTTTFLAPTRCHSPLCLPQVAQVAPHWRQEGTYAKGLYDFAEKRPPSPGKHRGHGERTRVCVYVTSFKDICILRELRLRGKLFFSKILHTLLHLLPLSHDF